METVFFNTRQLVVKFQCNDERRVIFVSANPTARFPSRLLFKLIHFFRELKPQSSIPVTYPACEIEIEPIQHTLKTDISLEQIRLISPIISEIIVHGAKNANNSFDETNAEWVENCISSIGKHCVTGRVYKAMLLKGFDKKNPTIPGNTVIGELFIGPNCVTNGSFIVYNDVTYVSHWATKATTATPGTDKENGADYLINVEIATPKNSKITYSASAA